MSNYILLENRLENPRDKSTFLFENPCFEWCCYEPQELVNCLTEMQATQKKGYYLVGYIAYEASYFLNSILKKPYTWAFSRPLLHFYGFLKPTMLDANKVQDFLQQKFPNKEDAFVYEDLTLITSKEDYIKQFESLKNYLYHGDSYQINLTTKYKFKYHGSPIDLYQQCRQLQKVAFGGILQFANETIVSLSPELFFRKKGSFFETKPMKGTMQRSDDPILDLNYKNSLTNNPKIVSENTIIVDLLRNDLSMISKPGSVKVEELFALETYETLHQMTSHICSEVNEDLSFLKIIQHIFPCGSITGAPKKRTMQIIDELEAEPRHIYTGCIGYITPNNDMCFNVAIRSFYLKDGLGELGVGGGVIYDSNPDDEYSELQLKAKFFTSIHQSPKLLESILYQQCSGYYLLEEHLERLKNSAQDLGFNYIESDIRRDLISLKRNMVYHDASYKVRLILEKVGRYFLEYHVINPPPQYPQIILYTKEVLSHSETLISHKTIHTPVRDFYQRIKSNYPEYFDVVFVNQYQQITESSYANIFIVKNNIWYTPPVTVGLLPGVMRQHLLKIKNNAVEKILYIEDLVSADQIFLVNSVKGLIEVNLCLSC